MPLSPSREVLTHHRNPASRRFRHLPRLMGQLTFALPSLPSPHCPSSQWSPFPSSPITPSLHSSIAALQRISSTHHEYETHVPRNIVAAWQHLTHCDYSTDQSRP